MPKSSAKSYIENYWDYQLPVQPERIAEAEGLRVLDIQLLGCENLSGAFKPDYEGMPTIFVNRTEGETRQRFTIAHELGHYALNHPGEQLDRANSYQAYQYDPKETQANAFAAELLMPDFVVDYLIKDENIKSVETLAEMFEVSENAMRFRLKNLGWLK